MEITITKETKKYEELIGKKIVFQRKAGTFEGIGARIVEAVGGIAIAVDGVVLPNGNIGDNIPCFFSNILEVK